MKEGLVIDCFAGGGGASVGIEMALGRQVDIAVNHDPDAILMHRTNHPDTLHLTEDIFGVDLQKYVKGRHVALMWASPDCTSQGQTENVAIYHLIVDRSVDTMVMDALQCKQTTQDSLLEALKARIGQIKNWV